jgi:hypothetical protein
LAECNYSAPRHDDLTYAAPQWQIFKLLSPVMVRADLARRSRTAFDRFLAIPADRQCAEGFEMVETGRSGAPPRLGTSLKGGERA